MTPGAEVPVLSSIKYEADLLGNIQQALAGLQGFDIMALELIQNADDAGASTLVFDVRDEALFVRNDATFSSCDTNDQRCPWEEKGGPDGLKRACNFHAIARMGSRSKVPASDQIGRFGIGFVSVYQVTDSPIVRSSGIQLRLDPLNGLAHRQAFDGGDGSEFELAWASSPSPTRTGLNASPTSVDIANLVQHGVSEVMARGLLFLRHLCRIELKRAGNLVQCVSIERASGLVTLDVQPGDRVERWIILSRDAAEIAAAKEIYTRFPRLGELDRSTAVQVAVPLSVEPVDGLLYAYLPTEQASGLPLHINADFFPSPNRRSIVLTGEQHERYWNELLLETAAHALGDNFIQLRDLLGAVRFWKLCAAAFSMRENGAFAVFWRVLVEVAKSSRSIWTTNGEWQEPAATYLPEPMDEAGLAAIESLGVHLVHPDLRPQWTVLSTIGVTQLRLSRIVDAIESHGEGGIQADNPHLEGLWLAVDTMIRVSQDRTGLADVIKRLKAAQFILDVDGDMATIDQVWRTPPGVDAALVCSYVVGFPLVHRLVLEHEAISALLDVYTFDALAANLAEAIPDEQVASSVIGTDRDAVCRFYGLLTSFETDPEVSKAGKLLADTPLLRTLEGFVSPRRGQLPGGFVDPIGHFELVDTTMVDTRMNALARTVLGVRVLTFRQYVEDHLEDILAAAPTCEEYRALLDQIIDHKAQLDDEGGLEPLANVAFVRTRAGGYSKPRDCYFWSASLEALLGPDGSHWVDENWLPRASAARLRDLMESRLDMRTTVATRHIVDRIKEIAEDDSASIDEIANAVAPIIRHVIERFSRMGGLDRRELERLRDIAFLPAIVDGERDSDLYSPGLVYRAARAPGFASQVPVVDLAPLRQASANVSDLLDLLKMPAEPDTGTIVAHLEHCMETGEPASDLVYQMLSDRLEKDEAIVKRLQGGAFIYNGDLGTYLGADCVFWQPPPFRGRWHTASTRMRQRDPLYRALGVIDSPGPLNFASLLAEIAGTSSPAIDDVAIHGECLAKLAEMLERGEPGADEAIEQLRHDFALLNLEGTPVWNDDAVWLDSPWLAEPFGHELDDRLVAPPAVDRVAASRLFRALDVRPLSQIAQLELASTPDDRPASGATVRLQERADLLLWLAPSTDLRQALRHALANISVNLTNTLQVHAEIIEFDPPVHSAPSSASAFFDPRTMTLHIQAKDEDEIDWSAAFPALFAQLESHSSIIDLPPVIMAATYVVSAASYAAAEKALLNASYRPPPERLGQIPLGEELGDAPEGKPDELLGEDPITDDDANQRQEGNDDSTGFATGDDDAKTGEDRIVDEPSQEEAFGKGAEFKSKAPGSAFGSAGEGSGPGRKGIGASGGEIGTGTGGAARSGPNGPGTKTGHSRTAARRGETTMQRQVRRSRMLTYVASGEESQREGSQEASGGEDEIGDEIDAAAIAAVLRYEQKRGSVPEEQPHSNPGYDIVSRADDGRQRIIEVKGLEAEWTERGVKLSRTQYNEARARPEEYWIYVVEHARDKQLQRVIAIANPFAKVEEYWFDHNWRSQSEENATAQQINIRVGATVRHDVWGKGKIVAVQQRGIAPFLTIDFGPIEGRRGFPYNSNLKFED